MRLEFTDATIGYKEPMRKDLGDLIFKRFMMVFPSLILLIVGGIVLKLVITSWPSIKQFGFPFVYRSVWDPVFENFGAFPFIYGTLLTSFVALLIAVPLGLGTAIFLAAYAPWGIGKVISLLVDLLAAIPSVIYGLWGIFVLVPLMRDPIQPFLAKYLGFLPFFKGTIYGIGFLTAGVILAVMIFPLIISVFR